jgi:hypothetical protein
MSQTKANYILARHDYWSNQSSNFSIDFCEMIESPSTIGMIQNKKSCFVGIVVL